MPSLSPSLRKIRDISNQCLEFLDKQSIPMLEALNIWLRLMLLKQWADEHRDNEIKQPDTLSSREIWGLIETSVYELGKTINHHLQNLELNNPIISSILADSVEFRWDKYGDVVLRTAINQISRIEFINEEKQGIGKVIETILDEKAKSFPEVGKYWIPSSILEMMESIIDPVPSWYICDPLCGIGRFFGQFLRLHQETTKKETYHLYGQESSLNVYALAKLYLGLQGFWEVQIDSHNVIEQPIVNEKSELRTFDAIFSVLPMSGEYWGYELAKYDPYRRFSYGLSRKDQGDWAYIQHILASLASKGVAVVVVSPNALYREKEVKIRQKIVDEGKLEAVIQLPSNLFYHTRLATVLMVFREGQKVDTVHFIDASEVGQKFKTMTLLTSEAIGKIQLMYCVPDSLDLEDKDKIQMVSKEQIKKTDYNLNPLAYFVKHSPQSINSDDFEEIRYWEQRRLEAMERVDRLFEELGIEW